MRLSAKRSLSRRFAERLANGMQTCGLYINIYEKGKKKEEKKRPSLPWHFRHFRAVCRAVLL